MNKQIQTYNFNIKLNLHKLYIHANQKMKLHMRILTLNNIITTKSYDFDPKGTRLNQAIVFDYPLKLIEKNRSTCKYESKNEQNQKSHFFQVYAIYQSVNQQVEILFTIKINLSINQKSVKIMATYHYKYSLIDYQIIKNSLKTLSQKSDHTMITEAQGIHGELLANSNIIAVSRNRINIQDKLQENMNTFPDQEQEIDEPRKHTPQPIILPQIQYQNNGLRKKLEQLYKKLQFKDNKGQSITSFDQNDKPNDNQNINNENFTTFRNEQKNEFETIIQDRQQLNIQSAAESNSSIHQKYRKLKRDYEVVVKDLNRVKLQNLELIQQNKTLLNIMKHKYD